MQRQVLYEEDGYTYIDVELSHSPDEPVDIILNCPHGFVGDGQFSAFPEIADVLRNIPKKILNDYLFLEHDFGSLEMAEVLFAALSKTKKIALIRFFYNRGILDGNREQSRAVRRIFNHIQHPELMQKLWRISGKTFENILHFCQNNLKPNGYFVDVHSMWPTNQYVHPSDFEHETRLEQYVDALLHSKNQKEVRAINFLVHDLKDNPVADEKRAQTVADHVQNNGFPVRFNEPYRLLERYNSSRYYKHFSGLSFDIPRTFLGRPKKEPTSAEWVLEPEKIHHLGETLADGILVATKE